MKKVNSKGFTLIELLAVITIMTILMLVAIPAVSRTIENTRRDSFANVAKNYLNTVRNAVLADELKCGTNEKSVGSTPDGTYYYAIDSTDQGTKDLMESGGKSSWGNAEVKGYIKWVKTTSDNKSETKYSIVLVDTGDHGIINKTPGDPADYTISEDGINRSKVYTKAEATEAMKTIPTSGTTCVLK